MTRDTTDTILTRDRIEALNKINRYNGWLKRDYSVLEHTLVGVKQMSIRKESHRDQMGFLLHDVEETEFGDIIRPVKNQFLGADYHAAVRDWNTKLVKEVGTEHVTLYNLRSHAVNKMDDDMIAAELVTVAKVTDEARPYIPERHAALRSMIENEVFYGPDAVDAFFMHFERIKACL
jgi:hypothetical protein